MRKVILGAGLSLDGYCARLDGSIDFLPDWDKESIRESENFFKTVDTVIYGRKTHDASKKLHNGGEGPKGAWKTYVFSRSQPPGERKGVTFVKDSPVEFLRKLRKRRGKNVCHMGGGELARAFLEADLIDRIWIGIAPVLLGEGIPFFPPGFPERRFELVECKKSGNGMISLRLERVRKKLRKS